MNARNKKNTRYAGEGDEALTTNKDGLLLVPAADAYACCHIDRYGAAFAGLQPEEVILCNEGQS